LDEPNYRHRRDGGRWLDEAAQAAAVAIIKNHPDSAEASRARDELLGAHRPLIRKHALRFAWGDGWLRELISAGIAGYLEAVPKFDPARGPLWPYVKRNVIGAIQDEVWLLGCGAVGVPEDVRADLRRLKRLDPQNTMEDSQVAESLGVAAERVVELRSLVRPSARLESPIASNSYKGDSKPRTLGENIPDGQRFPGWSRLFETPFARMAKDEELARWVGALYRAFDENEIGERNRRVVLSYYRATLVAMQLDECRETLELKPANAGPILTNRRVWDDTYFKYPDGHITVIRHAATAEIAADLNAEPDIVMPLNDQHPGLVAQRQADLAYLQRAAKPPDWVLLPRGYIGKPLVDKNAERNVSIAHTRLCAAYDWPFPQAVSDIALALGVTERAIYKVIARFNHALADIHAEDEEQQS
jgi:hypothetical protein